MGNLNSFTDLPMCTRCMYVMCPGSWRHFTFVARVRINRLMAQLKRRIARLWQLDYRLVENIEIADINHSDAPDYCNAFIAYAEYKGMPMSESQLDKLNEDRDFVYEQVIKFIY